MNANLEDLVSRDVSRILSAAGRLLHEWNGAALNDLAAHLPVIRQQLQGLEFGGLLFPNKEHVNRALKRIEHAHGRKGCLCALYAGYLMYNPKREEQDGRVRITASVYVQEPWVDHYLCECMACGARFRVTERESHYFWWDWTCIEPGRIQRC